MAATAANIICVVSAACMAYLPREHVWQRLVSFWLVNCQSVGFVSVIIASEYNNADGFCSLLAWLWCRLTWADTRIG